MEAVNEYDGSVQSFVTMTSACVLVNGKKNTKAMKPNNRLTNGNFFHDTPPFNMIYVNNLRLQSKFKGTRLGFNVSNQFISFFSIKQNVVKLWGGLIATVILSSLNRIRFVKLPFKTKRSFSIR